MQQHDLAASGLKQKKNVHLPARTNLPTPTSNDYVGLIVFGGKPQTFFVHYVFLLTFDNDYDLTQSIHSLSHTQLLFTISPAVLSFQIQIEISLTCRSREGIHLRRPRLRLRTCCHHGYCKKKNGKSKLILPSDYYRNHFCFIDYL